jgi:predicted alpha/beta hydrolase family esterase
MKRVVLVHGWDGGPHLDWFPWLAGELKNRGYEVVAPQLPIPEEPRKERWVPALAEVVGTLDAETYFIGHSMGCQTILRYLETLPEAVMVGGALFVAGFLKPLTNMEGPKEEEIARSWTDAPLDLAKVRSHLPKSTLVISDNDEWVPLENADAFKNALGSETTVEPSREHFNEDQEPAVLAAALKLLA